jgi:hypothetical protein
MIVQDAKIRTKYEIKKRKDVAGLYLKSVAPHLMRDLYNAQRKREFSRTP